MTKAKVWPLVKLAHYLVKRDGAVCSCVGQAVHPAAVCGHCYGTGWVGGYVLRSERISYYVRDSLSADNLWKTRTYQMVEPGDLTRYALGDILVETGTADRWSVCGFDAGMVYTRLVQPYEAAATFPIMEVALG